MMDTKNVTIIFIRDRENKLSTQVYKNVVKVDFHKDNLASLLYANGEIEYFNMNNIFSVKFTK